ncbi:COP9 signalosome complex subunit 5 [Sodiomyces alkalinus F11]|uniref:COP9 signalosome complex subunit 5 n=1 Tax=Sodiomyces alkalinus (strain CBS 110278 / VKM F-3762 / F11) TaxID=1314773 RepID=A0A3N2PVU8_SODAK|nr:COP9 signalosome complex subunit 5 [Sodiomyces alkalinus F11]ROT38476.1 COP9 signalosome complex subunit 5 [Sodiomyces alkalinus F11]
MAQKPVAPPLACWELENNVKLVDPKRDALYQYDEEANREVVNSKPWLLDPKYFKHVRISATALIKMVMHARSGGNLEVMGVMQGYINGDAFIVTDAFRLPVEGTETRVNAHSEADEYMVEYLSGCRRQGRQENLVGWYHSHPGYGCWLSGIDVATQTTQQTYQDPFLAVVIDPDRTISAGKVEIGAFRTHPPPPIGIKEHAQPPAPGPVDRDGWQAVPLAKAAEFGAHASKYYSLEVSHYKSTLEARMLELLWHKYWVQTLSQSPLLTNRDYGNSQMLDLASKIREVTGQVTRQGRAGHAGPSSMTAIGVAGAGGGARKVDVAVEKLTKDFNSVAVQERTGLMAVEVKDKLFNGLGPSSSTRA